MPSVRDDELEIFRCITIQVEHTEAICPEWRTLCGQDWSVMQIGVALTRLLHNPRAETCLSVLDTEVHFFVGKFERN